MFIRTLINITTLQTIYATGKCKQAKDEYGHGARKVERKVEQTRDKSEHEKPEDDPKIEKPKYI